MTSALPPNLLRLFAPRPPVPYLKPLTKDESERRPQKLGGIAELARRLRIEAEEEEYKKGLEEDVKESESKGDGAEVKEEEGEKMIVDEQGEVKDKKPDAKTKGSAAKGKGKGKDVIKIDGVIGPEAAKMRREAMKARKEEYKKNAEKNCEFVLSQIRFFFRKDSR
jgi:U1 small nuclear ribonucleoprotein